MTIATVLATASYPESNTLALLSDLQYHEPFTSAAVNRKLRGILPQGFYSGFTPSAGGEFNLLISSVTTSDSVGGASINVGLHQISVSQRADLTIALEAGNSYAIILKVFYSVGSDVYQVNINSKQSGAQIYASVYSDTYTLADGEILLCTVTIPSSATALTDDMIDTGNRINITMTKELSDAIDSNNSNIGASSEAVNLLRIAIEEAQTALKKLIENNATDIKTNSEAIEANAQAISDQETTNAETYAKLGANADITALSKLTSIKGTEKLDVEPPLNFASSISAEGAATLSDDLNVSGAASVAGMTLLTDVIIAGSGTANTASEGDNSTSLATTEYVDNTRGNMVNTCLYVSSNQALTVDDFGKFIQCTASSTGYTVTLPTANNYAGKKFLFWNNGSNITISTDGSDGLLGSSMATSGKTSLLLQSQRAIEIISDGYNWLVFTDSGIKSTGQSGYTTLPSGIMLQWGTVVCSSLSSNSTSTAQYTTGTFPTAWPNYCRQMVVTHDNPGAYILAYGAAAAISTTQYNVSALAISGNGLTQVSSTSMTMRYIAIGY